MREEVVLRRVVEEEQMEVGRVQPKAAAVVVQMGLLKMVCGILEEVAASFLSAVAAFCQQSRLKRLV